jgi:amino acid transporter
MTLKRELGVFGATKMGRGSIIGTGVFVSIGIAAGIAGPAASLLHACALMFYGFTAKTRTLAA